MRHQRTLIAAALASILGTGVGSHALAANEADPAAAPSTGTAAEPGGDSMKITAEELLDRSVVTANGEDVGEIQSVIVDSEGSVTSLVVGIGGFLGLGERDVALNWDQINMSAEGDVITLNMTKEELEGLPEYEYPEGASSGTAFFDGGEDAGMSAAGVDTPEMAATDPGMEGKPQDLPAAAGSGAGAEPTGAADAPEQSDVAAMETQQPGWTSALGPEGAIRATDFVGAEIMNADDESIGEVEEILIKEDNQLQAVVSVGGFLGVGDRHAVLDWSELNIERQEDQVRVTTDMSKDQIEGLPQYQAD